MTFPLQGSVRFGYPCECPQTNPPPSVDIGGISAVFDLLGHATAVGALATQLGQSEGPALLAEVAAFVNNSPTLARAFVETAGLLGAAVKVGGTVLAQLERVAVKTIRTVGRRPAIVYGVAGAVVASALGSQYLSATEKVDLQALADKTALVGGVLERQPPERLVAAAKALGVEASSEGGLSLVGYLGIALVIVAGLIAWKVLS